MNKFIVKPNKSVKEIIEGKKRRYEVTVFNSNLDGTEYLDVRNPQDIYNHSLMSQSTPETRRLQAKNNCV